MKRKRRRRKIPTRRRATCGRGSSNTGLGISVYLRLRLWTRTSLKSAIGPTGESIDSIESNLEWVRGRMPDRLFRVCIVQKQKFGQGGALLAVGCTP
jgi:hypothetical protein